MDDLMLRRRALIKTSETGKLWLIKNGVLVTDNYDTQGAVLETVDDVLTLTGTKVNVRTLIRFPVTEHYNKAVLEATACHSYNGNNPARPSMFVNGTMPTISTTTYTAYIKFKTDTQNAFSVKLDCRTVTYSYFGILIAGGPAFNGYLNIKNLYLA